MRFLNTDHPLARGMLSFYVGVPGKMGAGAYFDLFGRAPGFFTPSSTAGWRTTGMPYHFGDCLVTSSVFPVFGTKWTLPTNACVAAWVYPTSVSIAQYWFSDGNIGEFATDLGVRIVWNSGSRHTSTAAPTANAWNFLASQRYGSTGSWTAETWQGTLGTPVKLNGSTSGITSNPTAPSSYGMGYPTLGFPGRIAMMAVWNRRILQAELFHLWHISRRGYPGLLISPDDVFAAAAGGGATAYPWHYYQQMMAG